ncbi:MAG: FtsQ-type POTRA domain-containing protein [Phascolarctobacterium sp.]|nr:FtsQ-type POTRA domain-containing protein [Phascolarctobacterium sp.]
MQTMRSKLNEQRKKRRMRFFRLLICTVGIVLLLAGTWYYVHKPGFSFGQVSINGTELLTESDIIRMAGSQPPFNLFTVSSSQVRAALQHDVRFRQADAVYVWPGILNVTVEERKAALYVLNAYQKYLKLDYSGMVLNVTNGIPDADAPLLIGEECGNVYTGDVIVNEDVLSLLCFLQRIGAKVEAQVAEIIVDNQKQVKIQLRTGLPILLGKINQVDKKADIFMVVYNEIKDKEIRADYIDLTFSKPYIKLTGN